MSPLVTETLQIDADAVKRGAIKMARRNFTSQAKRLGDYGLCSPYIEHLANALRWHKTKATYDLELETERARRRVLSDLEREREDLVSWRDRIDNPLTVPNHLADWVVGGASQRAAEIARIDARLAEIEAATPHKKAA